MPLRALMIGVAGLTIGVLIGILSLTTGPIDPGKHAPKTWTTGEASVGGPFELVDQTGKLRTERDFRGKHMLVFFGFLYCPDICPATLQVITETLERLGDKSQALTPIFISVDPARDTPEELAKYLGNFDRRIVGLTGTPEQVDRAVKAYKAYYKKVSEPNLPDAYSIEHSTRIYLMGPDGRYVTHFDYGTRPADMARQLRERL